jgi:hypothetical protein
MLENWTSEDVQRDPQGFLKAQQQERTRTARERKEREETEDFEQFKTLFMERGGQEKDAKTMYDKWRSEKATAEAAELDQRARNEHRITRSRLV